MHLLEWAGYCPICKQSMYYEEILNKDTISCSNVECKNYKKYKMTEQEYESKLKHVCNEYIDPYGDEIILDGKFKLDEIKQIIKLMEEYTK